MNDLDPESTLVLDALRDAFETVTMPTPVEGIVAAGHARRHRRRVVQAAAGMVAVAGLTATVVTLAQPTTTSPSPTAQAGRPVHTAAAAFSSRLDRTARSRSLGPSRRTSRIRRACRTRCAPPDSPC